MNRAIRAAVFAAAALTLLGGFKGAGCEPNAVETTGCETSSVRGKGVTGRVVAAERADFENRTITCLEVNTTRDDTSHGTLLWIRVSRTVYLACFPYEGARIRYPACAKRQP